MLAACAIALATSDARAMCNVIPAATKDFRAALGSVNRPFAGPGEFVEIRVRPTICDSESTGFVDVDQDGSKTDDHVVTVLFVPPNGGTPNAVVLAEDCSAIDLTTCNSKLKGGLATCVEVNGDGPAGPRILVPSLNELQFRFPDTDDRVAAAGDRRTLAGPTRLVVTRAGEPLRCELADVEKSCVQLNLDEGTPTTGVVACIDELFETDGTCRVGAEQIDLAFGHFTALPPPNDYQDMCTTSDSACEEISTNPEFRFTTDVAGNALIPMDYTGILLRQNGVPIPQLSRATIEVDKFGPGSGKEPGNLTIPSAALISAHSPEGVGLPPIFTPLSDPTASEKTTLFGSVDAGLGVIRLSRGVCIGGENEGERCNTDAECTGGICNELFDFRDRYCDGVGPVLVGGSGTSCSSGDSPSGTYSALLDNPVPLEGLVSSQQIFAFVLSESLDGKDRNADGDARDFVATLRDRKTGVLQPLGPEGAEGRAVTRVRFQTLIDFGMSATSTDIIENSATSTTAVIIRQAILEFPAVATEDDIVAFLESEPAQGVQDLARPDVDVNRNFNLFDSILRVFRLGSDDEISNPSGDEPLTADAAPVINGRSMVVSQGKVFFRTAESAEAIQTTSRVSIASDGSETGVNSMSIFHSISADGRFVAFDNDDPNLVAGDAGGWTDVFVHDRDADENGIFDEPGAVETTRVSVQSNDSGGAEGNGSSAFPSISADGRYVAFESEADNLDGADTNGASDVFVRDRFEGVTTRVSVDSNGAGGNMLSQAPSISADGRFVAFESVADNLVRGDRNGRLDIFVHDRDTLITTRVNLGARAAEANGDSFGAAISADGRFVVFSSGASNLVAGDNNAADDVFVHDRVTGITARISVDSTGGEAIGSSADPAISADGRFVSFESNAANLVPGDTNGLWDLFVRDRDADEDGVFDEPGGSSTVRVRLDSADSAAVTSIAANGRFLTFDSMASDIVVEDFNGNFDVFLHDRVTGHTTRLSVGEMGEEADGDSGRGDGARSGNLSISSDGSFVAFQSLATNLVGDDGNGIVDLFVRGVDTADLAIDRSVDNELNDAVLRVLDTLTAEGIVTDLCPAETVAVAAGRAVFLRPEAAGLTDNMMCMSTDLMGPDLNDDGDVDDLVVHYFDGSVVHNLRCAAEDVSLSDTHVAALVSEAAQGANDLNGDGDSDDLVLHLWSLADPLPSSCSSWVNVEQAGDTIAITGDIVAMITPEADQNGEDLNGDGDSDDRVIQLFNAETGLPIPIVRLDPATREVIAILDPQTAIEFVLGTELLAFRTSEASQGQGSLNAEDADTDDDVLQIYDLATGELFDTGQTVVPCPLLACDPTRPYRVSGRTVRFLTLESDQNADLNDDGDQEDLLVQVFNTDSRQAKVVAEVVEPAATEDGTVIGTDPLATPGEADPDAGGQQVIVSTGRCVEDTQVSCVPGAGGGCLQGEFCFVALGEIAGRCVQDTGQTCFLDKPAEENGCPPEASCIDDFVVIGVADADNDQVPDAIDNCPDTPNTDQRDDDGDGVGFVCDLQICGDGVPQFEFGEECDDGNLIDNDGCDSNCRFSDVCGNGILSAGEECDDGNVFDGDGCSSVCRSDEDCEPRISELRVSSRVRLRNTTSVVEKSVTVVATLGAAPGRSCLAGMTRDAEIRLFVRPGGSGSDLFQGTIDTDSKGNPLRLTSGSSTRVKFRVEFDAADCNGPVDNRGNQLGTLSYGASAEVTQAGFDFGDTADSVVSGSLLCKP